MVDIFVIIKNSINKSLYAGKWNFFFFLKIRLKFDEPKAHAITNLQKSPFPYFATYFCFLRCYHGEDNFFDAPMKSSTTLEAK